MPSIELQEVICVRRAEIVSVHHMLPSCVQVRAILRNRSGIEDWILEKANYRRSEAGEPPFLFPYDLGRWKNIREVFSSITCKPKSDGIYWNVRPECHQYTLTVSLV